MPVDALIEIFSDNPEIIPTHRRDCLISLLELNMDEEVNFRLSISIRLVEPVK
jgi:hypothetical protein